MTPTQADVDAAREFMSDPHEAISLTKRLAVLLAQTREAERQRCVNECADAVGRLWASDAEIPFREAVVDMLNDMLVQRQEAEK